MDFADEHYVKLFTRDTVTWRSWPWQARAVFPALMRAIDHAGLLSVRTSELARSVALMVMMPEEVVAPALDAMQADGTVEVVGGHLVVPRFLEAQESRKTNAQSKREQREKAKAVVHASEVYETTKQHRQTAADGGRSGHPPALPCPALPDPEKLPREKLRGDPSPPRPEKVSDPRHAPLVRSLTDAYQRKRASAYPFEPRDAKIVTKLLSRKPAGQAPEIWPVVLLAAWERALDSNFPGCSSLAVFDRDLPKFFGTGPPSVGPVKGAATAADTDWSTYRDGDTARELFGDKP